MTDLNYQMIFVFTRDAINDYNWKPDNYDHPYQKDADSIKRFASEFLFDYEGNPATFLLYENASTIGIVIGNMKTPRRDSVGRTITTTLALVFPSSSRNQVYKYAISLLSSSSLETLAKFTKIGEDFFHHPKPDHPIAAPTISCQLESCHESDEEYKGVEQSYAYRSTSENQQKMRRHLQRRSENGSLPESKAFLFICSGFIGKDKLDRFANNHNELTLQVLSTSNSIPTVGVPLSEKKNLHKINPFLLIVSSLLSLILLELWLIFFVR